MPDTIQVKVIMPIQVAGQFSVTKLLVGTVSEVNVTLRQSQSKIKSNKPFFRLYKDEPECAIKCLNRYNSSIFDFVCAELVLVRFATALVFMIHLDHLSSP